VAHTSPSSPFAQSALRSVAAIALAALIPCQPVVAQVQAQDQAKHPMQLPTPTRPAKLDPDQRIYHALSRFTFGPTPDEIAAIRSANPDPNKAIDLWFESQLHPDRIPDAVIATRLAEYPALLLPVDQLIQRFPSNAEIRQAANGKRPIPRNPELAAIYRRHVDLYDDKQAKKAEEKTESAKPDPMKPATMNAAASSDTMQPAAMTMAAATPAASPSASPSTSPAAKPPAPDAARQKSNEALATSVLALPPGQRLTRIFAMQPEEYDQFHSGLKGPQKTALTEDMNANQRELLADFDHPTRAVIEELQDQRLLRDIYSERQLQEVMTTFWLNHFNVYLHKNDEAPYYLVSYERDVIRPRALGNFEQLLVATAISPAMLLYLDNSSSTGPNSPSAMKFQQPIFGKEKKSAPGLNENYARELMELHTLGVNGGYTQKDVTEVARVFTGWTVEKPQQGGTFEFDATRHDPGKKQVMGHKIKDNGVHEGLQLLHILATSPATAHFISQELAVTFVSDTPPPSLVNRMAQVFLKTNGDIASVLRVMERSPEFWSPDAYQAKIKTPLEYVVSAARSSGANITDPRPLVNALNQMGMPLYACVPPTGYSWKADAWVSTGELVTRMNFALSLATNHYGGIKSDWTSITQPLATPAESEQTLEARLLPGGVSDKTRAAVLDQVMASPAPQAQYQVFPKPAEAVNIAAKPPSPNAQPTPLERQNAQMAGLLLGSPEFQRR
jgi:uncharacterized protein (DUF1800 family)